MPYCGDNLFNEFVLSGIKFREKLMVVEYKGIQEFVYNMLFLPSGREIDHSCGDVDAKNSDHNCDSGGKVFKSRRFDKGFLHSD